MDFSGITMSHHVNLSQLVPNAAGFLFDVYKSARRIVVIAKLQSAIQTTPGKISKTKVSSDMVPFKPCPIMIFNADNMELVEEFELQTDAEKITDMSVVEFGGYGEEDHRVDIWISRSDGEMHIFTLYPSEDYYGNSRRNNPPKEVKFHQRAMIRSMILIDCSHKFVDSLTDDQFKVMACLAKTTDLHVVALWKADSKDTIV